MPLRERQDKPGLLPVGRSLTKFGAVGTPLHGGLALRMPDALRRLSTVVVDSRNALLGFNDFQKGLRAVYCAGSLLACSVRRRYAKVAPPKILQICHTETAS